VEDIHRRARRDRREEDREEKTGKDFESTEEAEFAEDASKFGPLRLVREALSQKTIVMQLYDFYTYIQRTN
jgi:hypothetical protein